MLVVNILGFSLVLLIVWWFWLYTPPTRSLDDSEIMITVVDGHYQPSRLTLPANTPSTLKFLRKDPSLCAATVVFAELDIAEDLVVDQIKTISLPPLASGEYEFTCQMQMIRGRLIVE